MADEELHRRLGAQLNNEVWKHLDEGTITAASPIDVREDLLYSAYASAHHWRQVGTKANRARAEHLVSRAAAATGFADVALRHAMRCLDLVESDPEAMEDWDLGFALEALGRAQAANGDRQSAEATLERARLAVATVTDDDDRAVLEGELARPPWFGLVD